jgi:hypothetical protein
MGSNVEHCGPHAMSGRGPGKWGHHHFRGTTITSASEETDKINQGVRIQD